MKTKENKNLYLSSKSEDAYLIESKGEYNLFALVNALLEDFSLELVKKQNKNKTSSNCNALAYVFSGMFIFISAYALAYLLLRVFVM
ncbi:MAG: hypothetical protein KBT27_06505 [Prevotellaceae bacterium]|nr:hypothetical protein [Candidatus Faecinaster equi]